MMNIRRILEQSRKDDLLETAIEQYEALEKQLKWEKALTVAHSDKITWLERVINVMLPLTPFADAEDALLTDKQSN